MNAFLYTKLKSICGVRIQILAEIGDRSTSFSYPRSRVSAQQALECLEYLDANEPFDFSDIDVRGSGSDISYDGDLGDDSGDDENGGGDGQSPNVVDGDDHPLVVGRGVCGRGRGRGVCGLEVVDAEESALEVDETGDMGVEFDLDRVVEKVAEWLRKRLVVGGHVVACEDADKDAGEETDLCTATEMGRRGRPSRAASNLG